MREFILTAIAGVAFIGYVAFLSNYGDETYPVPVPKIVKIEVPFYASDFIRP